VDKLKELFDRSNDDSISSASKADSLNELLHHIIEKLGQLETDLAPIVKPAVETIAAAAVAVGTAAAVDAINGANKPQ